MNAPAHIADDDTARETAPALEQPYLDLLADILANGVDRPDRTGVGTRGVFGRQMRFDLSRGFPLLTTKTVHRRSIVVELVWFLRGETNVRWLQERGVSIWDEWANTEGELGPVYGRQWPTGGRSQYSSKFYDYWACIVVCFCNLHGGGGGF